MKQQRRVAAILDEYDLHCPPEYRILDLASEVDEVAKDAAESTAYGESPGDLDVAQDEIGDVLFSVLALAESLGVDAGDALDVALAKYERRVTESGDPSSS